METPLGSHSRLQHLHHNENDDDDDDDHDDNNMHVNYKWYTLSLRTVWFSVLSTAEHSDCPEHGDCPEDIHTVLKPPFVL